MFKYLAHEILIVKDSSASEGDGCEFSFHDSQRFQISWKL